MTPAPPVRILVVEDELIIAADIITRLQRLGYVVVGQADRPEDAVRLTGELRPDLVLMDIKLQGDGDGVVAAEQIRSQFLLPVVYLTAHADEATLQRAKVTEPFGYVLKPFEERELRTVIEMALYKHQAERKLLASERRYATTLESIGDGVIATDTIGCVTFLNPVAERLTGWPLSQAAGRPLVEVFSICNEYTRQSVENPVDRVLREGTIVGLANHTILVNRDGSEVPIDDCAAPIHGDTGGTVGAVLVFRDVTESRRREEQLRHSQKMDAVGQLAGGIAHDFNNMLTAILGYTELLLRAAGSEHPWYGFLSEIQLASQRSADLTRQLLAFSRKDRSQPKLIDLNQVVTGLNQMLTRVLGEQVHLQTRLDASPGSILADPGQLEQVLVNLVVNARDAMPDGGTIVIETATVLIDQQPLTTSFHLRPGEYRVLRVIDTGAGMDAKTKSRIFEPFFTTKGVGKGTGLGLAVVYGIVQMCNGHIQVESVLGSGTTFTLYFPPASNEVPPHESVRSASSMPQGSGTVLLVEDESTVRGLAKHILISCGYTVLEAESGLHGLEVAERYSGRIDLVVSDLVMPTIGGRAMVSSLLSSRPEIKVLFMSGYEDPQVLSADATDFDAPVIAKPFTPQVFAKAVHALLQR